MRTIISTLGLVIALGACSEGSAPATFFFPGPSDQPGPVGDPAGPTQDNLFGTGGSTSASASPSGAGGGFAGSGVSTSAGVSTGSGGGVAPPIDFSCDVTADGVCYQYDNLPAADQGAEATACMTQMGTAGTSCSTVGELGSCALPTSDGIMVTEFYYSSSMLTATEAQTACTSANGTWTAA